MIPSDEDSGRTRVHASDIMASNVENRIKNQKRGRTFATVVRGGSNNAAMSERISRVRPNERTKAVVPPKSAVRAGMRKQTTAAVMI